MKCCSNVDKMNRNFDVIREEISRFHEEKECVILSELSARNFLYDWLNFEHMDFPLRHEVLKIVAKACTCTADRALHCEFIRRLISLKADLVTFVSVLLSLVQTEQRDCDTASILKLIFDVVHSIFQYLPVSSMDLIDLILPQVLFILKEKEVASELVVNVSQLLEQRKNIYLQESGNQLESGNEKVEPTRNFREVTLLLNKNELESQEKPYLRSNIIRGPYKSANHYLDIQFRLLREDMFRYFRESITEYKRGEWPRNMSVLLRNGYLYFDAQVFSRIYHNGVFFAADIFIGKQVDWNTTKILLPNSLLCMSCDGFQTFVFGCVHYRASSTEDSLSCYLEFSAVDNDVQCIELGKKYDIIETTAFYESYKYVLNRLQMLGPESFPLPEPILFIEDCDEKPEYWRNSIGLYSDLKEEFEKVLELSEFKNFDEHQQLAFQMAISSRVSVIQGPPGTGKTYLGLQITKWLLEHASDHMKAPVLVICYTNHALDQFLEGALKFTDKVVRIGGQSKNIALESHNIHNITYALQKELRRRAEKERTRFYPNRSCRLCGKKPPGYYIIKKVTYQSCYYEDDDLLPFCDEDYCDCWCDADREKPISESLKVGLNLLDGFIQLQSVGLYTCEIRETEKELEKVEKLINGLEVNPIYDENVLTEILQKNIWQEILCCLNVYSGKQKTLMKSLVKRLESWLCLTATFLHVYGDLPELLILIIENFLHYLEENEHLSIKLSIAKSAGRQQQNTTAPENSFMLGLWEMYLKLGKLPCLNTVQATSSDISNGVQYFLKEHILDKNLVFKVVEKSVSKYLERNSDNTVYTSSQIWEKGLLCRWKIFFKWKSDARRKLLGRLRTLQNAYLDGIYLREETRMQNNVKIAKKADILGLTTTGAAKHWELLEQVAPLVVVAEEAAEVLEAHITTALTKATQHLILIGDHKQLRPIPTVYDLSKRFKLDVSMFERLLINGAPSHCLQTQHRMRPLIAELLVPEIYENLENHASLLEYEDIKGMATNMYFIKHEIHEDTTSGLRSHRNRHEADFLIFLCRYLLQQGYKEDNITVLTTYVGQLKFLNEIMSSKLRIPVRVTTVDNFQGEENDIILLSFVRSNSDNSLGFLEISNRICVALSRARKGLYCIGNFDSFAEKSDTWNKIITKLKRMKLISAALPLRCQNHPERITLVSRASDFKKVIHGGCVEKCSHLLACEHVCPLQCHLGTRTHALMCCSDQCQTHCRKSNPKIVQGLSNISEEFSLKEPLSDNDDYEKNHASSESTATSRDQSGAEMFPSGTDTLPNTSGVDPFVGSDSSSSVSISDFSENHLPIGKQGNELNILSESEMLPTYELLNELTESPNPKVISGAQSFDVKCNEVSCTTSEDDSTFVTKGNNDVHFRADSICGKNVLVSTGLSYSESKNRTIYTEPRTVTVMDSPELKLNSNTHKDCNMLKLEIYQRNLGKMLSDETTNVLNSVCNEQYLYTGKKALSFSDTKRKESSQDFGPCDHLSNKSQQCKKLTLKKLNCQHEIQVLCGEYNLQHECKVEVEVQLPCHHSMSVTCNDWKWAKQIRCVFRESLLMPCGQLVHYTCSDGPSHTDCRTLVLKCGHRVPCYIDVSKYKCEVPIESVLPCSHIVYVSCTLHYFLKKLAGKVVITHNRLLQKFCSKECGFLMTCGHKCPGKCATCIENNTHAECQEKVQRTLSCGHTVECECHVQSPLCRIKCEVLMECGHNCSGKCGTCTRSGMHSDCHVLVTKSMACGHVLEYECHVEAPYCPEICGKFLECGHGCPGECGSCTASKHHSDCHELVVKDLSCGHRVECECYIKDPFCTVRCEVILSCKHQCPSECGDCSELQIHGKCQELVHRSLPCGHYVYWPCGSPLPACEKRCLFGCQHSRCINSCQYPCIKCSEPCEWKCEHFSCTMQCGELCNRPACDVRCLDVLKCGHQCAGYCGEPCPSVCVTCDKGDILMNIEEGCNWYVLLEDCQHAVLTKDIDRYFVEKSPSSCPQCPECGTVITKNRRFGNLVKSWLMNNLHNYSPETINNYEQASQWPIDINRQESSIFQNFISEMIQKNISLLFIPTAMKMRHNVCILRRLTSSEQSFSPDYKGPLKVARSLEQWHLRSGADCSGQQVEESSRAVRRVCAQWLSKKFARSGTKGSKNEPYYSEILTLLESKPFGDSEEQLLMEILHKEQTKSECKSNYASVLLSFIRKLNAVQNCCSYQEIDFSEYFGPMTRIYSAYRFT